MYIIFSGWALPKVVIVPWSSSAETETLNLKYQKPEILSNYNLFHYLRQIHFSLSFNIYGHALNVRSRNPHLTVGLRNHS